MNVFWHELKSHRISLIAWSVGLFLMIWTSMVKFATLTVDAGAANQLINQMPATIKTIFGMNGLDATSLGGYVGICALFVLIMLAVQAGLLGVSLITAEPAAKTTEFLYTKPASRLRIVVAKLIAGILILFVTWGVTYISWLAAITWYASLADFQHTLWLLMAAAGIVQCVFFSLGIAISALMSHPQTPGRIITGLIFGSYALSVVSQLNGYGWLHYASIFRYFDAADILHTGALKLHYVALCLVGSILLLSFGLWYFRRRDLTN